MRSIQGIPQIIVVLALLSAPTMIEAAPEPQLCAQLELRAAMLFRVGTASLYLPDCQRAQDQVLDRVPKKFSLELARSLSGDDLVESAVESLRRNLELAADTPLPEPLDCLATAYVDVNAGDRYDVVYRPEHGLALYLNDEPLRYCPDDGQAELYFLIWFGDEPFHRRMRDELLMRSQAARS
jgi:hypothetical protein